MLRLILLASRQDPGYNIKGKPNFFSAFLSSELFMKIKRHVCGRWNLKEKLISWGLAWGWRLKLLEAKTIPNVALG